MIDHPNSTHRLVKELFIEALEFSNADEVQRFLDRRCGAESSLKAAVNCLLEAHHTADPVLDGPDTVDLTIESAEPFVTGQRVGKYEVGELIGEGGMGLVYRAEQTHPIRRSVALKIIKPGLDTREVLRRFRLEQEVLGRLEHPHIARVFDAGQTEMGNPYFVMELVEGTAIDAFCDREQLSVQQRLRSFNPCALRSLMRIAREFFIEISSPKTFSSPKWVTRFHRKSSILV
jgi:serine/threonine protein kinase